MRPEESLPESEVRAPWTNERYELLRLLGSGSFGDVYLARDRVRGHDVALKMLRRWNPEAVARLRREFRALKCTEHPNLVRLYELHADSRQGFLTMEVVYGQSIVEYVASALNDAERLARARDCLAQLVAAVATLHAHGTIHRDLKPSNALVTGAGRVVVLDAGLAKSIHAEQASQPYVCGTPGYMSPEQALGEVLSEASDWYSTGVIAYELFTGHLPFEKHPAGVLLAKVTKRAPSIAASCPELAGPDVATIDALLAREPAERPNTETIFRWLGIDPELTSRTIFRGTEAAPVLGRDDERRRLDAVLAEARETGLAVALISGPSGIGKTALVKSWLEQVDPSTALVLAGRCYQRESVLFSGFEDIFDSVAERMSRDRFRQELAAEELASLEFVLGSRFDLGFIDTFSNAVVSAPPEPLERRRLVGRVFARLLAHLAGDRTLVLWLDDLQWGGVETAMLLADITRARFTGGCALLASSRPVGKDDGACLPTLGRSVSFTHELDLGPLPLKAAVALVAGATSASLSGDQLEQLVRDAGGHPLLLQQAAHRLVVDPTSTDTGLGQILSARVQGLSLEARKLLAVLAIAAEPVPEMTALRAVGLDVGSGAVGELLRGELAVRVGRVGHCLVPFHDQLRDVVVSSLPTDEARALNMAIAGALETTGQGQPEALVAYYLAAGERRRAAQCISSAAANMARALAFDRAAKLFRMSLDLAGELGDDETQKIRLGLADALVNCGHVAEGARVRLEAASLHASGRGALVAQAASELVRAGRIDEGLQHAQSTFEALGLRLSKSGLRALPFIAMDRSRITVRGLRHELRIAAEASPQLLQRIDWCQSLGLVLSVVDTLRGFQLHNQGLLSALEAGEPARLGQSLAMEAGFQMALGGGRDASGKVADLLRRAHTLAQMSDSSRASGIVEIIEGSTRWSVGDWQGCVRHVEQGIATLRRSFSGVFWEINFGQTHALDALRWMGELRKVRDILSEELEQARARGDLYAETLYTLRDLPTAHLVADRVLHARACSTSLEHWPNRGFQVEHMVDIYKQAEVDLYENDGAAATRRVEKSWRQLSRSQLMRLQPFRIELLALRARALVAAASREPNNRARGEFLRLATRAAAELDREVPSVRGDVFGAPVAAAVASLGGSRHRAMTRLEEGIDAAARSGMRLHENALRYQLGKLRGGQDGRITTADAEAWMRSEDVRCPEKFAGMLCPAIG